MVYVTSDGRVVQQKPWELRRFVEFFGVIIFFLVYFFKSLFGLEHKSFTSSFRNGNGGGNSYGDDGPGGPNGGPRRNFRRFQEIKNIQDKSMPGCSSCG